MTDLIDLPEIKSAKRFNKPRVDEQKAPPILEFVSLIEIYKLGPDGDRIRRVCGQPTHKKLPSFVPEGIGNPHGVTNPREEYRCLLHAGSMTSHKGLGPCRIHTRYGYRSFKGHKFKKYYNLGSQFEELIREEFLHGEQMDNKDVVRPNELGLQDNVDFDSYVEKVRKKYRPEDLFDSVRYLYELEAIREALKDKMREEGEITVGELEMMSDQIIKSSQFMAAMAKRDSDLMQASALQASTKVMITGVLHIVQQVLGRDKALEVLGKIKNDLILPASEVGAIELLRRQMAAGISDDIGSMVEEAEYSEVST
jgi:hypothetical protein